MKDKADELAMIAASTPETRRDVSPSQNASRLTATERRAVEVLACGEWPDSPNHGTWRAKCMVTWLKDAGIQLLTEKEIDAIHSDGFRQGFVDG